MKLKVIFNILQQILISLISVSSATLGDAYIEVLDINQHYLSIDYLSDD